MADNLTQQPNGGTLEERIMARFDAMDVRFTAIDTRLDAMDTRLDAIDARLDAMDARFDAMDARFDAVEARLSALEEQAEERKRETRPLWEKALADIAGIAADMKEVKSDITIMIQDMHKVRAKQFDLEIRVREIETAHPRN